MRHHNKNRKFGRVKKVREALISSLVLNLIIKGKIKTTLAKAKELRPVIEPMVTRAKKDTPFNRAFISSKIFNKKRETKRIFEVIAPKYTDRKGGYTRISKLGPRKSDGAEMAIIEFI